MRFPLIIYWKAEMIPHKLIEYHIKAGRILLIKNLYLSHRTARNTQKSRVCKTLILILILYFLSGIQSKQMTEAYLIDATVG